MLISSSYALCEIGAKLVLHHMLLTNPVAHVTEDFSLEIQIQG